MGPEDSESSRARLLLLAQGKDNKDLSCPARPNKAPRPDTGIEPLSHSPTGLLSVPIAIKLVPATGPLHLLVRLPEILIPQIFKRPPCQVIDISITLVVGTDVDMS